MARQPDPKSRPRLPNLFTRAEWQILAESLGLTRRQMQIARWICLGLKNRELAVALDIAPDTVRMHRRAAVVEGGEECDDGRG